MRSKDFTQRILRNGVRFELVRIYADLTDLRFSTQHLTEADIDCFDRAGYHVAQAVKYVEKMLPNEKEDPKPLALQR